MAAPYADRLSKTIVDEWLPAWKRKHAVDGPLRQLPEIDADIARSVVRALERGVVEPTGVGSFTLRGGRHKAAIFWHGSKHQEPRRVLFAYEGLISVAMANDLYDVGWRGYEMAFEVLSSAFDVGVFDARSNLMLIVGEAKSKARDVDRLVEQIRRCGRRGSHDKATCPGSSTGHAKYVGLIEARPQLMWIVAPGARRLLSPIFLGPGHVDLVDASEPLLQKPRKARRHTVDEVDD